MSVFMPYVNTCLNLFGLLLLLIITVSCARENRKKKRSSHSFLLLLIFVCLSLGADTVCWICEGNPDLKNLTLISNTIASASGHISILCFMHYLIDSLYSVKKRIRVILAFFRVLLVLSILFITGNAFFGYAYGVNAEGHYVNSTNQIFSLLYIAFPVVSFVALVLMALFARGSKWANRAFFILYTIPPLISVALDYMIHEAAFTYVGTVISILIIYTNVYLEKEKLIEAQKNALMLSQINPHFTYNTLTAIAAMCDRDPKLAKSLTIEFSHFLRQNLETLTSEGMIPLEKELLHVKSYLKIESARFREKLRIIYAIEATDFSIPPLTIQPIVENAVKHGITQKPQGGTVKIITRSTKKSNIIEVIDDGVGFDVESRPANMKGHVGLTNVKSRLKGMCGGTLSVKSEPEIGTRVTLEIPRRKERK